MMEPRQYKKVFLILAAVVMAAPVAAWSAARNSRLPGYQSTLATLAASAQESKLAGSSGVAQASGILEDLAKKLTAEERTALNRPDDPNGRAKTYVKLMRERLKTARNLLTREQYAATSEQLEVYVGLVDDASRFLSTSVRPRDKAHKTLEQGLKEQIRVLEGIRRDVTAAHLEIAEKALETANRVRRQALNALLGDGKIILHEPGAGASKRPPLK
jgi:hypothetical protein